MVELELNNHLGNDDNGVVAVAGNIKDNLSIFQSPQRNRKLCPSETKYCFTILVKLL
jgi:hypothetical protein